MKECIPDAKLKWCFSPAAEKADETPDSICIRIQIRLITPFLTRSTSDLRKAASNVLDFQLKCRYPCHKITGLKNKTFFQPMWIYGILGKH